MVKNVGTLPLTIISGYLGSGKTTLVNHLLRNADGRRIMVLVNDFGELPIDVDLIESRDGDTINLANGCACCSMGGDLFNALVDVLDRRPWPDHLLIEASGVADPARIANIALAEPDLSLDATISLVDAGSFLIQVYDPLIGDTLTQQLASSDLVLLNKADQVDEGLIKEILARIERISASVRIVETKFGQIPLDMALGINLADPGAKSLATLTDNHAAPYVKWSGTSKSPLDRAVFEQFITDFAQNLLRLKGIVRFSGHDEAYGVQCVGSRCEIAPLHKFDAYGQNRLVAIGLKNQLDLGKINSRFEALKQYRGPENNT